MRVILALCGSYLTRLLPRRLGGATFKNSTACPEAHLDLRIVFENVISGRGTRVLYITI